MPNWSDVLNEVKGTPPSNNESPLDIVRRRYLTKLSRYTKRPAIAYYSGWLTNRTYGTDINDEDKNGFMLCVHGLRKDLGLDLILHTPGGDLAATESLIHYLKEIFGNDIRAIVPHMAMSAGTVIACSCKSILIGKHSNLGPTDPQVAGLSAFAIRKDFGKMYQDIINNPEAAKIWMPIISQLKPAFLTQCDWAMDHVNVFVKKCLKENMFAEDPDKEEISKKIVSNLADAETNRGHGRHFHYQDLRDMGLKIEMLEDDSKLQDLVLTAHHCYAYTLSNYGAVKIIENSLGKALIKSMQPQLVPSQPIKVPGRLVHQNPSPPPSTT